MAKKQRKLVYNGHKGLPVGTRCIWCGEQTADPAYIINPGGNPLMACCCEDHFQKTNTFVRRDNKIRPVFYVVLFVFVAIDLVMIGYNMTSRYAYLPLLGIALTVCAWPSVFTHYQFYVRLGLVKTRRIIRIIMLCIAVLALASTLSVM